MCEFTYRYIDDVLSINDFKNHLHEICRHVLEIKFTNQSDISALYLDIFLLYLSTILCNKRDYFNFNFK